MCEPARGRDHCSMRDPAGAAARAQPIMAQIMNQDHESDGAEADSDSKSDSLGKDPGRGCQPECQCS